MRGKIWHWLFVFAVVLLGWRATAGTESVRFGFASWNIGHYALGESPSSTLAAAEAEKRGASYRGFLNEVGADVLGVCEYSENFTCDSDLKAKDAVFARYAQRRIGAGQAGNWRRNAQLWNGFELVSSTSREFSRKRDPDVRWLETRLRKGTVEIVFVQAHLDWNTEGDEFRTVRADEMRELAETYRHEPHVVIAGDFNPGIRRRDAQGNRLPTVDDPSEYKVFADAGYTLGNDGRFKTTRGGASSDVIKGCALDNIIVRGFKLSDFKVWERYDLSDHALVSAVLEVEDAEPRPGHPQVTTRFSSPQTCSRERLKKTAKAFAEEMQEGSCVTIPSIGVRNGGFKTCETSEAVRRHDCLAEKPDAVRQFTVLTWNTQHYGWGGHSAEKQTLLEENMFKVIRAANPDVFLQQETYGSFERFRKALPEYDAVLQNECSSVFSKFPIVSTRERWRDPRAPEPLPMNAPALSLSELKVGDMRLRVGSFAMFWLPLCVLLPADRTPRELLELESREQDYPYTPRPQAIRGMLAAIEPDLADRDRMPLLIGGDFNSLSHLDWTAANGGAEGHFGRAVPWTVSKAMTDAGFVDAWRAVHPDEVSNHGVTAPMAGCVKERPQPWVRIDYVYSAGTRIRPIAAELIGGSYHRPFSWRGKEYAAFPSDHAALLVTYEVISR